MTNSERQKTLDKQKYVESQKAKKDLSGKMVYCEFCDTEKDCVCRHDQEERESKCLCAKAFNRMRRK